MNAITNTKITINKDVLLELISKHFILDNSYKVCGVRIVESQRDAFEGIEITLQGTLPQRTLSDPRNQFVLRDL